MPPQYTRPGGRVKHRESHETRAAPGQDGPYGRVSLDELVDLCRQGRPPVVPLRERVADLEQELVACRAELVACRGELDELWAAVARLAKGVARAT